MFKIFLNVFILMIAFLASSCDKPTYAITFNSNGGTEISSITAEEKSKITKPSDPIKEGYTFNGWYSDSSLIEPFTFKTMPSSNITLYASWSVSQYSISFNSNGGSIVPPIQQEYNTIVI